MAATIKKQATQQRTLQRRTLQRSAILEALEAARRPLGPQELLQAAKTEAPNLGLATVYRALKSLQDEGRVVAVELPGEATRFEMSHLDHHHHFQCRQCSKVFDLECHMDHVPFPVPKGFSLERQEVLLYGLCATCSR